MAQDPQSGWRTIDLIRQTGQQLGQAGAQLGEAANQSKRLGLAQEELDLGWARLMAQEDKMTKTTLGDLETKFAMESVDLHKLENAAAKGDADAKAKLSERRESILSLGKAIGKTYELRRRQQSINENIPDPTKKALSKYVLATDYQQAGKPVPDHLKTNTTENALIYAAFAQKLGVQGAAKEKFKKDVVGGKNFQKATEEAGEVPARSLELLDNLAKQLNINPEEILAIIGNTGSEPKSLQPEAQPSADENSGTSDEDILKLFPQYE